MKYPSKVYLLQELKAKNLIYNFNNYECKEITC